MKSDYAKNRKLFNSLLFHEEGICSNPIKSIMAVVLQMHRHYYRSNNMSIGNVRTVCQPGQ